MGTKKSKPSDTLLVGSVVVVGYSERSTERLIKSFRRMCDTDPNQFFTGRYTYSFIIDEELAYLKIRSMQELSQSFIRWRRHYIGLMLMYNVRDEASFHTAKQIAISPYLEKEASEIPIVMVGCGCQHRERREVSYYMAREFADDRGIPVVEVCEKEGVNVELAFMTLVGEMLLRNRFRKVIDIEFDVN